MAIAEQQSTTDEADCDDSESAPTARKFSSGVVLAIVGTFLFALKSIFIKLAFAEGATPVTLLSIRMLFALPFYILVLYRSRSTAKSEALPVRLIIRALALGFLGYYLAAFLDLSGLEHISAQLERLTLFAYPAIVAILAGIFLGERLNAKTVAAILLSYAGVLVMYGQERSLVSEGNTKLGVLLVAGAALSYSLYVVFAKATMLRIGSRQFTSLAMIGSTFFVCVHAGFTGELSNLIRMKPIVYAYGLIMAFVCTVIPSFMINEAILRIGATKTSVIGTVGPVLTMLLAIVVLQEPSSVWHVAGMALSIVGVYIVAQK